MPVTLRILGAQDTLAKHETTIRQSEELKFELVSLAAGRANDADANLVSLRSVETAPAPIHLMVVEGDLTQAQQEAKLNTQAPGLVCYGTLLVEGKQENVAAHR